MSTVERCRHEMIADQCAICTTRLGGDPFDVPAPDRGPWIVAHYPGRCAECGTRFEEYEPICATPDGYVGQCCGDPS